MEFINRIDSQTSEIISFYQPISSFQDSLKQYFHSNSIEFISFHNGELYIDPYSYYDIQEGIIIYALGGPVDEVYNIGI